MNASIANSKFKKILAITPFLFSSLNIVGEECADNYVLCKPKGDSKIVCTDANVYKKESFYRLIPKEEFLMCLALKPLSADLQAISDKVKNNQDFRKEMNRMIERAIATNSIKGGVLEAVKTAEAREIIREALINNLKPMVRGGGDPIPDKPITLVK